MLIGREAQIGDTDRQKGEYRRDRLLSLDQVMFATLRSTCEHTCMYMGPCVFTHTLCDFCHLIPVSFHVCFSHLLSIGRFGQGLAGSHCPSPPSIFPSVCCLLLLTPTQGPMVPKGRTAARGLNLITPIPKAAPEVPRISALSFYPQALEGLSSHKEQCLASNLGIALSAHISCIILGKLLNLPCLSFLICQMGIWIVSTSWSGCKD